MILSSDLKEWFLSSHLKEWFKIVIKITILSKENQYRGEEDGRPIFQTFTHIGFILLVVIKIMYNFLIIWLEEHFVSVINYNIYIYIFI